MNAAVDSLVHLDVAATVRLNYKRLYELYGDEGDVLIVTTRDPDNPNRITTEARLPNIPLREMQTTPKTESVAAPKPSPPSKTLFDLEHPLSETPKQTDTNETPLDPTAETGNRGMQASTVLEFPRERIVVQRNGDFEKSGRISESQWYLLRAVAKAGKSNGLTFDDLISIVPEWNADDTEYNTVYQMVNSLNSRLEELGIVCHVWTTDFVAFIEFAKRPERKRKQRKRKRP